MSNGQVDPDTLARSALQEQDQDQEPDEDQLIDMMARSGLRSAEAVRSRTEEEPASGGRLGLGVDEVRQRFGQDIGREGEDLTGALGTAGRATLDLFDPASRGVIEAAASESAVSPFVNMAELVGAELPLALGQEDIAANVYDITEGIKDVFEGSTEAAEETARKMGVSPEGVAASRELGHFEGFTVPLTGALKAADKATWINGAWMRFAARDFVAGTLFGTLGREGDIKDRLVSGASEGAAFGVFSLALGGAANAMIGYRNRRMVAKIRQKRAQARLERSINEGMIDPETGVVKLAEVQENGQTIMQMMSETNTIARSQAGRRILQESADERAFVGAVLDLHSSEATHGVLRDVRNPENIIPKIQEEFPSISTSRIRRSDKGMDLVFGTKGLSNKQKAQYKREGLFEGQRIVKNGTEYEYIGRLKSGVKARRLDSKKVVTLKDEGIQPLVRGTPPQERTPSETALMDRAVDWLERRTREVAHSREGMTEFDVMKAVREGDLTVSEFRPRDVVGRSNTTTPAARGLPPDGFPRTAPQLGQKAQMEGQIMYQLNKQPEAIKEAAVQVEGKTFKARTHPQAVQKALESGVTQDALHGADVGFITTRGRFVGRQEGTELAGRAGQLESPSGDLSTTEMLGAREVQPQPWGSAQVKKSGDKLVVRTLDAEGNPVQLSKGEEQALLARISQDMGEPRVQSQNSGLMWENANEIISREGLEDVWRMHPDEPATFDALMRRFAEQEGLQGQDLNEFVKASAQRARQRIWQKIPQEEKRLMESLRDDFQSVLEEAGNNLERRAALNGFRVRHNVGQRVELRDVNSGAPVEFGSEEAALEALKGVERSMADDGTRIIPSLGSNPGPEAGAGGAKPEGFHIFPDERLSDALESALPSRVATNVRDWFQRIEERSGLRIWSEVFNPLDEGVQAARRAQQGWMQELDRIWRGHSREDAVQIARWWREIEGQEIAQNSTQAQRLAKRMGLSSEQLKTAREARALWNQGFVESGVPEEQFIRNYYGRIQPYAEETGDPITREALQELYPEGIPSSIEAFFEQMRTGEMSRVEMDPRLVMSKWFRAKEWQAHVGETWNRARALVDEGNPFGLNDLPGAKRAAIVNKLGGEEGVKRLAATMRSYLGDLRGFPDAGLKAMRRVSSRLLDNLNIQASDRLIEQYANAWMSSMYGSAIGPRPQLFARNATQNLWFSYSRIGGKKAGPSLERAMSVEGFLHADDAGALRTRESGVPFGELILESQMADAPVQAEGGVGSTLMAGAIKKSMGGARAVQNVSRNSLTLYSSVDDMNRAWAFHWKRMHVDDWLQRFEAGKISEEKFFEEALPFDSPVVREQFSERLDKMGRDEALDFIGKVFADENHFIYGTAAQPEWMRRTFGRFVGMFGTWPVWAKEMYFRRVRHGTLKNKARFALRHALMGGAVGMTAVETGIDLWNWMAPTSVFSWFGGPAVDFAYDVKKIVSPPRGDEVGAAERLARDMGRISYPYQGLIRDVSRGIEASDDPRGQITAIMLGRPERAKGLSQMDRLIVEPGPMFESADREAEWRDSVRRWKKNKGIEAEDPQLKQDADSALKQLIQAQSQGGQE